MPSARVIFAGADQDGVRYCRDCRGMQPLSEFPAGVRRFFCRRHLYERSTRPAKLRVQADDKRRVLNKLWARCWRDSKALGQTGIQLDQREIAQIVEDRGIGLTFAIVPMDASHKLSHENVAVVVNEARRDLIWAYKLGGAGLYTSTLETLTCAASPPPHDATAADTENLEVQENKGTLQHILN